MAVVDPIRIDGLAAFQKALKAMDGESQKKLRLVLNEVSSTIAAGAARRVPRGPSGRAKKSLKVASQQRFAQVKGGGKVAPYYGWLDFGGRTGRRQSVRRPFVASGRYLYPALAANRESTVRALEDSLADLAREAGLEVTGGQ